MVLNPLAAILMDGDCAHLAKHYYIERTNNFMEIIAKTSEGFLIQATTKEVTEVLKSVAGKIPEKIEIGQKIPAMDYSLTISNLKGLKNSYGFNQVLSGLKNLNESFDDIKAKLSLVESDAL